ncbi:MAG TPA: hypothetical protein VHZ95_16380 [Polyangiales bacterium]|nr:hypothetical protein [Polyangiales bacterium]
MRPDRNLKSSRRALCLLSVVCLFGSACKVTNADIDTWKGTRKGPGKMVAVMLANKFDLSLRTYAALELVEMDRQDVDGVTEMQRAIQKLEPETRVRVVEGVADGLIALMKKPTDKPSSDGGPPPYQVRAKDAAFLLVPSASPEVREKLTTAVVGWYTEDFNGRSLSGNFSAEQVVRGLGAAAARSLVDALNAKLPQQALIKLAELIGQVGDAGTRQRAGQRLVAIEREMEGPSFLEWLKGQIKDQMAASGVKPDPARIAKAAEINRGNFIDNGVLPAMKYLADQSEVASRLLELASHKDPKLTERRTNALQALEGKLGPEHLDQVLALALDSSNPVPVRDYAFDRVGDIRSPKALASMWPLLSSDDQRLRWRAGELILTIGGSAVLTDFFNKLPSGKDVSYEPEELDGYAQRMAQMNPAPRDAAISELQSADWWDEVIALDYFQRKGTEAEVAAMDPLTKSATAVKGKHWDKGDTVGKVAERAIAGLRERLKEAGATGPSAAR